MILSNALDDDETTRRLDVPALMMPSMFNLCPSFGFSRPRLVDPTVHGGGDVDLGFLRVFLSSSSLCLLRRSSPWRGLGDWVDWRVREVGWMGEA